MRRSFYLSEPIAGILLAVLLQLPAGFAQSTYGSVVGVVGDSSDAVMPGVAVTLTSLGTNERHSTVSGRDGFYQFQNVMPASYRLEAELAGFRRYVVEPVVVEVQRSVRVDMTLAVGQTTERIDVSA